MKKNENTNLEKKKVAFFQIGLIIALAIVLLAFEWSTSNVKIDMSYQTANNEMFEDMIPITQQEPPKPPPPQSVVDEIKVVDNDIEIENSITIPDLEIGLNDSIDIIPYILLEEEEVEPIPFYAVEVVPQFLDGKDATLINWLVKNSNYPPICVENNVSGTVWVSFIINQRGKITNVSLLRSIHPHLDAEAIRLIKSMPDWKPGVQAGRKVPVPYQLPVKFILE